MNFRDTLREVYGAWSTHRNACAECLAWEAAANPMRDPSEPCEEGRKLLQQLGKVLAQGSGPRERRTV